MSDTDAMRYRLNDLESRIAAARARLTLDDAIDKDHAVTADELTAHYRHLQQQLDGEAADLQAQGMHVDSFEKTVMGWINGLTAHH